jgi:hypothetical protein
VTGKDPEAPRDHSSIIAISVLAVLVIVAVFFFIVTRFGGFNFLHD